MFKFTIYILVIAIGSVGYSLYFKSGFGYIQLLGWFMTLFISIPAGIKLLEWLKLLKR